METDVLARAYSRKILVDEMKLKIMKELYIRSTMELMELVHEFSENVQKSLTSSLPQ